MSNDTGRHVSPERLETLLVVANPKGWLALAVAAALVVLLVAWSFLGRIPMEVEGVGVLMHPQKIVPLQSEATGMVTNLLVKVGDTVQEGQVVATVSQPDLTEQLRQAERQLATLEAQFDALYPMQQSSAKAQIVDGQAQHDNIQKLIDQAKRLDPVLEARLAEHRRLNSIRALSLDQVISAEQAYLANRNQIPQLEAQARALKIKEAELKQQLAQAEAEQQTKVEAVQAQIDLLKLQMATQGQIVSKSSGKLIEVAIGVGQMVAAGMRVGTLAETAEDQPLVGVMYFPVKDGKKIAEEMPVQITPDTVQRALYGGITGKVQTVSLLPLSREAIATMLGNDSLAAVAAEGGPQIQIVAELDRDPDAKSGFRWSASRGPETEPTVGTTVSGRVVVKSLAPIMLAFEVLRTASGLE